MYPNPYAPSDWKAPLYKDLHSLNVPKMLGYQHTTNFENELLDCEDGEGSLEKCRGISAKVLMKNSKL